VALSFEDEVLQLSYSHTSTPTKGGLASIIPEFSRT
ncbi:MAG: hypothetical protein ACI9QL_005441, partial [Candidatus Omnitrophota bacterium]